MGALLALVGHTDVEEHDDPYHAVAIGAHDPNVGDVFDVILFDAAESAERISQRESRRKSTDWGGCLHMPVIWAWFVVIGMNYQDLHAARQLASSA